MNKFNLIDEPWIPVIGAGLVSLRDVFLREDILELGGNPAQKISVFKLLISIAQAAWTPATEDEWSDMDAKRMAELSLQYLEKWHDSFWLYGEKPFLQMPQVKGAKKIDINQLSPETASNNRVIISNCQINRTFTSAEIALLLITDQGFGLGGKKGDSKIILSKGYEKKTDSPGPHLGMNGYMHSFVMADSLIESVFLNIISKEKLSLPLKFGRPTWEQMPSGEDCDISREMKESLQGHLVPLGRFCFLIENEVHYTGGIVYKHSPICFDISLSEEKVKEDVYKLSVVDPSKVVWKNLTALLTFINSSSSKGGQCLSIKIGLERALAKFSAFKIWSGGLKVTFNSGEQYVTGLDDYVESCLTVDPGVVGEIWFQEFIKITQDLKKYSDVLVKSIEKYFSTLVKDCKNNKAFINGKIAAAKQYYWQLTQNKVQQFISEPLKLQMHLKQCVFEVYDLSCPNSSAKELASWVKNKPKLSLNK